MQNSPFQSWYPMQSGHVWQRQTFLIKMTPGPWQRHPMLLPNPGDTSRFPGKNFKNTDWCPGRTSRGCNLFACKAAQALVCFGVHRWFFYAARVENLPPNPCVRTEGRWERPDSEMEEFYCLLYVLVHITWIQTQSAATNFWVGFQNSDLRTDSGRGGEQHIFRSWTHCALWDLPTPSLLKYGS